MQYTQLLTEERDGVFVITLNRPEARNALSTQLWKELCEAFDSFERDDDAQVCIMTHSGNCFCAGSDLKELAAGTQHPPKDREEWGFGGMTRHYISKPIIIAVNGKAIGGGAEMLISSDLAVLSSDGTIGFPEVKRALLATGGGGLLKIGRSIPVKRAMELMLTAETIDAETALDWGLVNRISEPGKALDTAFELAQQIIKNGPLAIRWTKMAIYDCMDKPWLAQTDGWRMMLDLDKQSKKTLDAKEGEAAFAEHRDPQWQAK